MKIALIQCPVWGTYDPPLALAQLSACLKTAGHEVKCFDLNISFYIARSINYKDYWAWEQSILWYRRENVDRFFEENKLAVDKCIDELIATGARVVGFSVNAASRLSSLKVAQKIKNINKDIVIVFGGPLFFEKSAIGDILKHDYVDMVVDSEGEVTFVELANSIDTKKNIADCDGVSFKSGGAVVSAKPRKLLESLDSLPFSDFTDLPFTNYDDSRHMVMMASRGCLQRCAFCSSRSFWPQFRAMSGKRIFEEIKFHKLREGAQNPHLGHVDFLDLMFNGNIGYLTDFCELMIKEGLDIKWSANMIIRPEMTSQLIEKMKRSGCEHIIFGIESGSQNVLNLMKKHYRIEDADRIIREMHEAGICVTGNFMFGFPGEGRVDFEQTLAFLRRNAGFLDRAYPSRTYCAIEEFSYLAGHLNEFGIKENPPNHLFWESLDGANNYPERLMRCREFSQLARSLKIDVGCGVQTSVDLDEFFNLYLYYEQKKDFINAVENLLKYFELNRLHEHIKDRIKFYFTKVKEGDPLFVFDEELLSRLGKAVSLIQMSEKKHCSGYKEDSEAAKSRCLSIQSNSALNDAEFADKKIILSSGPKKFIIEANAPYAYHFIFDKKTPDRDLFSLKTFRANYEEKLLPFMAMAEEIEFFGEGDFLSLDDAMETIDYFDLNFPDATKRLSTKAGVLTPEISGKILSCSSKFTIDIRLPACSQERYGIMANEDILDKVLSNIADLLKARKDRSNPAINILFNITTLNLDELPGLIDLCADLGVNQITCRHATVYNEEQKYLSCFFNQRAANKVFSESLEKAKSLDLKVDFPYPFGKQGQSDIHLCKMPWSQVILGSRHRIFVCKSIYKPIDTIEFKNFNDIWNSQKYQTVRKSFTGKQCPCFDNCIEVNQCAVNNFKAHKAECGTGCIMCGNLTEIY